MKKRHLCIICAQPAMHLVRNTKRYGTLCVAHYRKRLQLNNRRNEHIRIHGLCVWCRKPASETNHAYCEEHRRYMNDKQATIRAKRKEPMSHVGRKV